MKFTDRKAHVLAYLVQELPLKWQDRDCGAHLTGAAAKLSTAAASIESNAAYCIKTEGCLDVNELERIPSNYIREAAMSCGTALAYLELTAAMQGWEPRQILKLADSGYELAHGENGFEKPAREHGMDEVGYHYASADQRAEWIRVLSRPKKEEPAGGNDTDEPKG